MVKPLKMRSETLSSRLKKDVEKGGFMRDNNPEFCRGHSVLSDAKRHREPALPASAPCGYGLFLRESMQVNTLFGCILYIGL